MSSSGMGKDFVFLRCPLGHACGFFPLPARDSYYLDSHHLFLYCLSCLFTFRSSYPFPLIPRLQPLSIFSVGDDMIGTGFLFLSHASGCFICCSWPAGCLLFFSVNHVGLARHLDEAAAAEGSFVGLYPPSPFFPPVLFVPFLFFSFHGYKAAARNGDAMSRQETACGMENAMYAGLRIRESGEVEWRRRSGRPHLPSSGRRVCSISEAVSESEMWQRATRAGAAPQDRAEDGGPAAAQQRGPKFGPGAGSGSRPSGADGNSIGR